MFRGGEGALQVLPKMIDVLSEARLNLVIYYLKQENLPEAFNLIKDLEPMTPQVMHVHIGIIQSCSINCRTSAVSCWAVYVMM